MKCKQFLVFSLGKKHNRLSSYFVIDRGDRLSGLLFKLLFFKLERGPPLERFESKDSSTRASTSGKRSCICHINLQRQSLKLICLALSLIQTSDSVLLLVITQTKYSFALTFYFFTNSFMRYCVLARI